MQRTFAQWQWLPDDQSIAFVPFRRLHESLDVGIDIGHRHRRLVPSVLDRHQSAANPTLVPPNSRLKSRPGLRIRLSTPAI